MGARFLLSDQRRSLSQEFIGTLGGHISQDRSLTRATHTAGRSAPTQHAPQVGAGALFLGSAECTSTASGSLTVSGGLLAERRQLLNSIVATARSWGRLQHCGRISCQHHRAIVAKRSADAAQSRGEEARPGRVIFGSQFSHDIAVTLKSKHQTAITLVWTKKKQTSYLPDR